MTVSSYLSTRVPATTQQALLQGSLLSVNAMSDCTSSEDDPFDDAVDTLDPDPTISVLGITTTECSILAAVLPLAFKTPTIQTFFVGKTSIHELRQIRLY